MNMLKLKKRKYLSLIVAVMLLASMFAGVVPASAGQVMSTGVSSPGLLSGSLGTPSSSQASSGGTTSSGNSLPPSGSASGNKGVMGGNSSSTSITSNQADIAVNQGTPTVTSINPTSGPTAGGTTVTINGTNLTGVAGVGFGTVAAASFISVSDSTLTAVSPAGTGIVDVTVTTPGGTSATSPADQFTYVAPLSFMANIGASLGYGIVGQSYTSSDISTYVTASGGTKPYTYSVDTSTLPPGLGFSGGVISGTPTTPGTYDVTVDVTDNSSPQQTGSAQLSLIVFGISPASGPAAGGTLVTITGGGFVSSSTVTFGTTPATNVNVVSGTNNTEITCDSPAGTGTVDVTVTAFVGTDALSPVTLSNAFTYVAPLSFIPKPGASLGYGIVGQLYTSSDISTYVSVTGGTPPYTYSVDTSTLPPGLGFSGGVISGTPTVAGTYSVTVDVTDNGSPQETVDAPDFFGQQQTISTTLSLIVFGISPTSGP